jgi:hypothetical protein
MTTKIVCVAVAVLATVHFLNSNETTSRKLLIAAVITALACRVFFLSTLIGPAETAEETKSTRSIAISNFNAQRAAGLEQLKLREQAIDKTQ